MSDDFIPRIVYEDSVSVYADGSHRTISAEMKERYEDLTPSKKPILVINANEVSPEKIQELIDTGFYKKLFCDVDRIEWDKKFLRNSPGHFKLYFTESLCCGDDVFNAYEQAKSHDEKRSVLEKNYDKSLQKTSAKDLYHRVKKDFLKHPEFTAQGAEKEEWFRKEYHALTRGLKATLEKVGVQYVVIDKETTAQTGNRGLSDYSNATIYVEEKSQRVLSEEMVHQADYALRFSERYDWKRAVNKDITPNNQSLAQYYDIQQKASLFDGSYQPDSWATEALTDVYNILMRTGIERFPNFRNDFPKTHGLFQEFMAQLDKIADEFKGAVYEKPKNGGMFSKKVSTERKVAEPEQKEGAGMFSKKARAERESSGSSLSRGSERTEPEPRSGWVKTVTP